jgi:hypothetical protein
MARQTQESVSAVSFALSADNLTHTKFLASARTNRRNNMTTTTLTLTLRVKGVTLDEMRERMRHINDELEGMFPDQAATITDIKISDDSKARVFVSKLAE